ncbi:MAG: phosphoenolpyruvate carboxykinase (ATP), partial [Deltaproteobacteria bacterium]
MEFEAELEKILGNHRQVIRNLSRKETIAEAVNAKEAIVAENGCLATWTPPESTGRAP